MACSNCNLLALLNNICIIENQKLKRVFVCFFYKYISIIQILVNTKIFYLYIQRGKNSLKRFMKNEIMCRITALEPFD